MTARFEKKPAKQYEELLLEVRRVTRVTTGGRRLSFRATIVIGNKKGKIGLGVSKAVDVATAVKKATHEAYKDIKDVPVVGADTVPYPITFKYKSAVIKLLPAAAGTGLKAGSSVRSILGLAGYNNILSKIVGTNNKLNNALATINALVSYKAPRVAKKAEETVEKETTTKKAPAKKATAKKAPAKKTAEKKAPAKKAPAKKPAAKKTAAKKAPAKKEDK